MAEPPLSRPVDPKPGITGTVAAPMIHVPDLVSGREPRWVIRVRTFPFVFRIPSLKHFRKTPPAFDWAKLGGEAQGLILSLAIRAPAAMTQIVIADGEFVPLLAAHIQRGFRRFIRGREQHAALLIDQRSGAGEKFVFSRARPASDVAACVLQLACDTNARARIARRKMPAPACTPVKKRSTRRF
jgi:hypothetical protein